MNELGILDKYFKKKGYSKSEINLTLREMSDEGLIGSLSSNKSLKLIDDEYKRLKQDLISKQIMIHNKEPANLEKSLYREVTQDSLQKAEDYLNLAMLGGLGGAFALPSSFRKLSDLWKRGTNAKYLACFFPWVTTTFLSLANFISSFSLDDYSGAKMFPYLFGAQIVTNVGSGIYESVRHVKKKAIEKRGELLEDIK